MEVIIYPSMDGWMTKYWLCFMIHILLMISAHVLTHSVKSPPFNQTCCSVSNSHGVGLVRFVSHLMFYELKPLLFFLQISQFWGGYTKNNYKGES